MYTTAEDHLQGSQGDAKEVFAVFTSEPYLLGPSNHTHPVQ